MVGNNTEWYGEGDRDQLSTVSFNTRTYGSGSKEKNVVFIEF